MSEYRPYDGYEPNEPPTRMESSQPRRSLSPARPIMGAEPAEPAYRAGTDGIPRRPAMPWDQVETAATAETEAARRAPASEAQPAGDALFTGTGRKQATAYQPQPEERPRRMARPENPYARPTWDQTEFEHKPTDENTGRRHTGDTDAYPAAGNSPRNVNADAVEAEAPDKPAIRVNRYARPATDAPDSVSDLSSRFAPPLKFELPKPNYSEIREPGNPDRPLEPNVYQTRRPVYRNGENAATDAANRYDAYRVEEERGTAGRGRRRPVLRGWLIALSIMAILGGGIYLGRDWLLTQLKGLLGEKAVETVHQAIEGGETKTVGYDPAPAVQIGDKAKRGINAVASGIGLESYAATGSNVVARVKTGEGVYDYYLFAAKDGLLLGYYEGLGENGFLVCPNDVYYVAESPYLINAKGLPLIDATRYQQSAGADAVLGPMVNGWSIISNAKGTAYNYINADGNFLSTLWFAKAYPFTADSTVAYVDTGNVTNPAERYALYELGSNGSAKLWKHAADMEEVLGCACGVACLRSGEIIRLDGTRTVLCTTDEASAYVDCAAIVARDPKTGLYGLYVNGEQHYDFAYDSIAPVQSDIQWKEEANGLYKQYTVTGMAYPLPLSHYFTLRKGETQEMVALSTGSVYPLLLNDER